MSNDFGEERFRLPQQRREELYVARRTTVRRSNLTKESDLKRLLKHVLLSQSGKIERSAAKVVSKLPLGFAEQFPMLQLNPEAGGLIFSVLRHPKGNEGFVYQILAQEMIPPSAVDRTCVCVNIYVDSSGCLLKLDSAVYDTREENPTPSKPLDWPISDDADVFNQGKRLAEVLFLALSNRVGEKQADGTIRYHKVGRGR